jgi:signal transduction histidine kinase
MLILARQMNLRFEERLAERTRIARELHDSLLQGFQGLMFRLQAVRDLLPARPAEAAQALDTALDRGDQVIAEGRSTVEDLRDSTLQDTNILQALTSLGEELASSNNGLGSAPLRVLVEGPQRELDPILRDEVYRIAREALRNAFQHSHARKIEAEVTYSDAQFSLRVRDDGNGIDPKVFEEGRRSGHWGLPGMRERATALGGQLHVWSESGAGTEIELTIPGSVAYVDSSSHSGLRSLISNFRGNDGRRS